MRLTVMLFVLFLATGNIMEAQWSPQTIPGDVSMILSVSFADTVKGLAGGYRMDFTARALRTSDGGRHWLSAQVPDTTRVLVSIVWVDSVTAYAAGAVNVPARKSGRPGWGNMPMAIGYGRYLRSIGFDGTGSYRGYFLRTTDAGGSWSAYGTLPDSVSYLIGASFVSRSIGYVTADTSPYSGKAAVLKTSDGGLTWMKLATPDSIIALRKIEFVDSLKGVAVGYSNKGDSLIHGVVIRTTDGGTSWSRMEFPLIDNFTGVSFSSASVGYITGPARVDSGPAGIVYRTTDAGVSWHMVERLDTVLLEGIAFQKGTGTGVVFGIGTNQNLQPHILRTTDSGSTWTSESILGMPAFMDFTDGILVSPRTGYIAGGDGLGTPLILYGALGGSSAVGPGTPGTPAAYALRAVYPNPFNPSARISYSIPVRTHVRLEIYNVLGELVETLANADEQAGTYRLRWDAGARPSGLYLLRITAGEYTQTRKLALIR